jgi:C-terminal processing protease CtpA/Prc
VRVTEVEPNGAAAEAGVRPGDLLVQVGEIAVTDATFGARFRARYGRNEGTMVPLTVRRNAETLTLNMPVRIVIRTVESIVLDRNASPKALRIRQGILTGTNRQ